MANTVLKPNPNMNTEKDKVQGRLLTTVTVKGSSRPSSSAGQKQRENASRPRLRPRRGLSAHANAPAQQKL